MGIVFNFGNELERMQPGEKITFGKLDFIANQLGNLCLQELEMLQREEEWSLPVRAFSARLEEVVDGGLLAI
jgi:hypothetical protein